METTLLQPPEPLRPLVERLRAVDRSDRIEAVSDGGARGLAPGDLWSALVWSKVNAAAKHHSIYALGPARRHWSELPPERQAVIVAWAAGVLGQGLAGEPEQFVLGTAPARSLDLGLALADGDPQASADAAVAMSRRRRDAELFDILSLEAARDWSFIGHRSIAVEHAWGLRESLGDPSTRDLLLVWTVHHLRFVSTAFAQDQQESLEAWEHNRLAVKRGVEGVATPPDVLSAIRDGDPMAAGTNALRLAAQGVSSAWDAIIAGAADLLVRAKFGLEVHPVHAMTSVNAMRRSAARCTSRSAKLQLVAQAASCCAYLSRLHQDLRAVREPLPIEPQPVQDLRIAMAQLADILPPRLAGVTLVDRAPLDAAAMLGARVGSTKRGRAELIGFIRRELSLRAGNAHDVKFAMAVTDELGHAPPPLRPLLAAAATQYIHGPATPPGLQAFAGTI